MLLTLENGLNVDLLFPEKIFHRVYSTSGYCKDFSSLKDAEVLMQYDFLDHFTLYKVIQSLDDFGKVTDTTLIKV